LFLGCWLVARGLEQVRFGRRLLAIMAVLLLVPAAIWRYQQVELIIRPDSFYSTNEATTTVANEYMPKWVSQLPEKRAYQEIEFYKGRGTIQIERLTTQKVVAYIVTEEDSIIQINSIYYPGWGVLVNGSPVKIDYQNPSGLIRFSLPTGSFNIVSEFRETVPRFIATLVSGLFFLLWIGVVLIPPSLKQSVYRFWLFISKDGREEIVMKKKKRKL
jgi:hypothetical protein